VESLARILVLLLLIILFLRLISGGWTGNSGVTAWLRSKFIGAGAT